MEGRAPHNLDSCATGHKSIYKGQVPAPDDIPPAVLPAAGTSNRASVIRRPVSQQRWARSLSGPAHSRPSLGSAAAYTSCSAIEPVVWRQHSHKY